VDDEFSNIPRSMPRIVRHPELDDCPICNELRKELAGAREALLLAGQALMAESLKTPDCAALNYRARAVIRAFLTFFSVVVIFGWCKITP